MPKRISKSSRGQYSRPPKRPYRDGKKPKPTSAPSGVFLPDKEMMVRLIAMKGATDSDIEDIFMCPRGSVTKWRQMYSSFAKAIESGRSVADGDVMFAFYNNCVGYKYKEQQAVGGKHPAVLEVEKWHAGEFPAQKHWLQNRQGWKSSEGREHSTPNGPLGVKVETRDQLFDRILSMVTPKPDEEESRKEDSRR